MPAREEEFHHAVEEGIICDFLTNPIEILGDEKGNVAAMRCIRMELGEPDASGRRSPVPIAGSEFEMKVDTVIFALGTSPNPIVFTDAQGLQRTRHGTVVADARNGPHQARRRVGGRRRGHRRGDGHQRHGRRQARGCGHAPVPDATRTSTCG